MPAFTEGIRSVRRSINSVGTLGVCVCVCVEAIIYFDFFVLYGRVLVGELFRVGSML